MRFAWVLVGVMGLAGIGTAAETCTAAVRVRNQSVRPAGRAVSGQIRRG